MNQTAAQLSLTIVLLATLAALSPVAKAQGIAPAPTSLMIGTGEAVNEAPQVLQVTLGGGSRQFERRRYSEASFVGQKIKRPYRLIAGAYFSQSSSIVRGAGALRSFEFEYDYKTNYLFGGPTVISFFANLESNKRYVGNASAEYTMNTLGVGIAARRVFTQSLDKSHASVGLGLGFFGTGYRIDPYGPARYQQTNYSPGVRVMGGYQFGRDFFIQADYLLLDNFRIRNASGQRISVNPSGARVGLGYRF